MSYISNFSDCCGLEIFHNLYGPLKDPDTGHALIAVTNSAQKARELELLVFGFEHIATFKGNYRNNLKLWLRHRQGAARPLQPKVPVLLKTKAAKPRKEKT